MHDPLAVIEMSPEIIYDAWKNYHSVRLSGNKRAANLELENLIQNFQQLSKPLQEEVLINLVGSFLDKSGFIGNNGTMVSEDEMRIQHPFFKQILLPYVIENCKKNQATSFRWAAQLSQFFYSDHGAQKLFAKELNIQHFDCEYLLMRSYELEPLPNTAQLILGEKYKALSFATHELPRHLLSEPQHYISYYEEYLDFAEKATNRPTGKHFDFFKKVYNECKKFMEVADNYSDFETYLKTNNIILDW